jgi:hypothetical protein
MLLAIVLQVLALLLPCATSANGEDETIQLNFRDNTFSAHIENAPLPTVLTRISEEQNLWIRGLERLPTAGYSVQFEDMPFVGGLERILAPVNHCLLFDDRGRLEGIVILTSPGTSVRKPEAQRQVSRSPRSPESPKSARARQREAFEKRRAQRYQHRDPSRSSR